MQRLTLFDEIEQLLINRRLSKALQLLENLLYTHADLQQYAPTFQNLKYSFGQMEEYWKQGIKDPQQDSIYMQLVCKCHHLLADISNSFWVRNSHTMSNYNKCLSDDWTPQDSNDEMEGFVSDVAMLDLVPSHLQQEKREKIYADHERQMRFLFYRMLGTSTLKKEEADVLTRILLSPTIDSADKQLLTSAIILKNLNHFDINRFHILAHLYEYASDVEVKQRALVGVALSANASMASLYEEVLPILHHLCENDTFVQDIVEMQMQMIYCMEAEKDQRIIRDEIMPDLMKGNHLTISGNKLTEMDTNSLEEILHPEASEQNMERMENSMRRMADMQRKGSDIYFTGFSQMKRFPFFSEASNWLLPFYPDHPAISKIWNIRKNRRMLQTITEVSAFCNSDKYSFVLAFEQVVNQLPPSVQKLIDEGETSPMPVGGEVSLEQQRVPAFVRRMFLQDLYRFFRLYPYRDEFSSPFNKSQAVFIGNELFSGTRLEEKFSQVASFLMKRKYFAETIKVLENINEAHRDLQYYLLVGYYWLSNGGADNSRFQKAREMFEYVLSIDAEHRKALLGYARTCFQLHDYSAAHHAYLQLLVDEPENRNVLLNVAVCEISMKQYSEALKRLYKLNYENGNDEKTNRVLAWALALSGKYEQAIKLYDHLCGDAHCQSEDLLNYGYCLWFSGRVNDALQYFHQFLMLPENKGFDMEQELMENSFDILKEHGITEIDCQLMLAAIQ